MNVSGLFVLNDLPTSIVKMTAKKMLIAYR